MGTYEGDFDVAGNKLSLVLRCETEAYCELDSPSVSARERLPVPGFRTEVMTDLRELRTSLQFARDRKSTSTANEEARAIREVLRPLLDSTADLSRCITLQLGSSVCQLDSSPWNKPTVIYFGADLANCRQDSIFCGYVLLPMFQTAKTVVMSATSDRLPADNSLPPVAPEVQDYVRSIQQKVQSLLQVPPGTKAESTLLIQVFFNQEVGSVYSTTIMDRGSCDCPAFKTAAFKAVKAAWPIPLLPKEKWQFLGGRDARLYLVIRASP